jgi:hypothetical protein
MILDRINQKLKAAKVGLRLVLRGNKISLAGTFPPRENKKGELYTPR